MESIVVVSFIHTKLFKAINYFLSATDIRETELVGLKGWDRWKLCYLYLVNYLSSLILENSEVTIFVLHGPNKL